MQTRPHFAFHKTPGKFSGRLLLAAVSVVLLFQADLLADEKKAYVFEATILRSLKVDVGDLELFLFSLEGIVNRSGPRLILANKEDGLWFHSWSRASEKWMEYLKERKGFTFVRLNSLEELIDTFKQDFAGLVMYDDRPEKSSTRLVAATLAGLENLLPVGARLAALAPISQFPVKRDLRHKFDDGDYLEPYRWALRELMPRCDKTIACNLAIPSWSTYIDYPVMRRAFCFSLNHQELVDAGGGEYLRKEQINDHERKTWKVGREGCITTDGGETIDLYKIRNELPLAQEIYKQLTAPAYIFGVGRPNEMQYTAEMSKGGHSYICSQFSNLSFFSKIPVAKTAFRQDFHRAENKRLGPKYYIAFVTSDGDAPKLAQTFYAGHWFDPSRGAAPITWTINPKFAEWFPVFFEYYYATATQNDYFMCAANGAGSPVINLMPDVPQFARASAQACTKAGLYYADIQCSDAQSFSLYAHNAPGIRGFTNCLFFNLDPPVWFVDHCPPWATYSALWYWKKNTPLELKADIQRVLDKKEPPYFLIVYPDFPAGNAGANWKNPDLPRRIPTLWKNTVALLDSSRYEAVTIDAFFDLIKQAYRFRFATTSIEAAAGTSAKLSATIRNFTENRAPGGRVSVTLPPGLLVGDGSGLGFPDIAPGDSAVVRIPVAIAADARPGAYVVRATIVHGRDTVCATQTILVAARS
jgi:hypothetical protein